MIIYQYEMHEKYKDLADGTPDPNYKHKAHMNISGKTEDIVKLLDSLVECSNNGVVIENFNYKIE